MKLEVEISDELWKRIEHSARFFRKSTDEYLRELLNGQVLNIPDPVGAAKAMAELRASAGPEDDYDIDEFLEALERNRGRERPLTPDANGEAAR
jgi:hypothetical protein